MNHFFFVENIACRGGVRMEHTHTMNLYQWKKKKILDGLCVCVCPSIVVQTAKKTVVEFYFVFPFFSLFIHCSRHTMGDDDDPMIHNDGMNVKNKKKGGAIYGIYYHPSSS